MKKIALFALLSSTAAFADPLDPESDYAPREEVSFISGGEAPMVGQIIHRNAFTYGGAGPASVLLFTPLGQITLTLTITPNSGCVTPCPDTLEVIDLPPGLIATPSMIETQEGQTGVIAVYHYLGS